MSERYAVKHDPALAGGSWKVCNPSIHNGGFPRSATMKCPNGHIGSLADHTIASDGRVEPSVVCPAEGCDFHEFVILEGWQK